MERDVCDCKWLSLRACKSGFQEMLECRIFQYHWQVTEAEERAPQRGCTHQTHTSPACPPTQAIPHESQAFVPATGCFSCSPPPEQSSLTLSICFACQMDVMGHLFPLQKGMLIIFRMLIRLLMRSFTAAPFPLITHSTAVRSSLLRMLLNTNACIWLRDAPSGSLEKKALVNSGIHVTQMIEQTRLVLRAAQSCSLFNSV